MSVLVMAWAWSTDAKGADKLLLLAIADRADDDGVCWLGQKNLGAKCGVTDRAIRAGLGRLETAGLIEREHRQRENGSRTSDLIRVLIQPEDSSGRPPIQPEVKRRSNRKPTSAPDTSEETLGVSRSAREGEQQALDVPADRVDRLVEWHRGKVEAKIGRPPSKTTSVRPAASELLRLVGEDSGAIVAMWEFAGTSPFWADKVLTLPKWKQHFAGLRAAQLASVEQARSRPQRRDEPREVPKARRTRYDQDIAEG